MNEQEAALHNSRIRTVGLVVEAHSRIPAVSQRDAARLLLIGLAGWRLRRFAGPPERRHRRHCVRLA